MSLSDLSEDRLIGTLTRRWPRKGGDLVLGVGDDCAALRVPGSPRLLLLKTDAVIEAVHFLEKVRPTDIGWKALARNLSDIAAMGGQPDAALVALAAPPETPLPKIRGIYRGLRRCADRFGVRLVGGESARAEQLSLTIMLTGWVARRDLVSRSGARPGDVICVTGHLGGSGEGHHLTFCPRLAEGQWLARNHIPSAMMDISDGLAADLPRLCKASGVGARLDPTAIPTRKGATLVRALSEGEDFELLFTVRANLFKKIQRLWPFPTPVSAIGEITAGKGIRPPLKTHGFDHFRKS